MNRRRVDRFGAYVEVDRTRCLSCGACVAVCPPDSIFLDNLSLQIDEETCSRCERCLKVCPVTALHLDKVAS